MVHRPRRLRGWLSPPRQGSTGRRRASAVDCRGPKGRAARGGSRPTAPRDPSIAARSLPSWGPGQPDRPAVERQWLAYCCHMPTPARPLPVVGGDRRASVSCYLDGASGFILEFEKAEPELGTGELW